MTRLSESASIAISRYGTAAASTRVRLDDWFSHLGMQTERWDYIGTSDNRAPTLIPRIRDVVGEEIRLRRAIRKVRGRTVIMSRGASPFSSGWLEESLLNRAAFSIYDFDDAIFTPSPSYTRRKIWSEDKVWRRAVQAADRIIAGSDYLAEAAAAVSDNVVLIPSCVEPGRYTRKQAYEIGKSPVAVWIGTPSTERFLLGIADALLAVHRRIGLRLRVISAGNASLGPLDPMIDRVVWNIDTFPMYLATADMGIMPLPDTDFERGKCAYKLLQYGATGLPMLGSPVGANVQALEKMGGIGCPPSLRDWVDALEGIIGASTKEREAMGDRGRDGVERHYSYRAWADTWLSTTGLSRGKSASER